MSVHDWPSELQQRPWEPTPDDRKCQGCDGPNIAWWVQTALWVEVVGHTRGNLCPSCFVLAAEERGIGRSGTWQLYPPGDLSAVWVRD